MNRRELMEAVKEEIAKGGKDKDAIVEAIEGLKDTRALGRVFSDLRLFELYPIEVGEDKEIQLLNKEEFENYQEEEKQRKLKEREAKKKKKTPKVPPLVRFHQKQSRFNKSLMTFKNMQDKYKGSEDEIGRLRIAIAQMQHRIAAIEYNRLMDSLMEELEVDSKEAVVAKLNAQ